MSRVSMRRTPLSTTKLNSLISLIVTPTSGTGPRSVGTSTIVTLTRFNSYNGTVTLFASNLPAGVTASFTPSTLSGATLTSLLTLTVDNTANVTTTDILIRAAGSGTIDATTTFSLTVTNPVPGINFFRPATINSRLPQGIISNYDVMFDEATGTVTNRLGTQEFLWPWEQERVGGSKWLARTATRTVVATGNAGETEFLGYINDFVNSGILGDWEIRLTSITLTGDNETGWRVPGGCAGRRLWITYDGVLPTKDVMPDVSTTTYGEILGWNHYYANNMIKIDSSSCPSITFTGIRIKPQGEVYYGAIVELHNASAAAVTDLPTKYIFDRSVIDGSGTLNNCVRGITGNCYQFAFLESYILDIRNGAESKGFGAWSGAQYQFFRRGYFEAHSICNLYGGADPSTCNGLLDPHDNFHMWCSASKKASWFTENAGGPILGIKNGWESKNVQRWFIYNCISFRSCNTGQPYGMIFQNLQDSPDHNYLYNSNDDIVVYNHQFKDNQNGVNVLSRIAYGSGTMPVNPTRRLAIVNWQLINLGENFGASGYAGVPFQLISDIQGTLVDQWTLMYKPGFKDYMRMQGSGASDITITNMTGEKTGAYGEAPAGNFGQSGISLLSQYCDQGPYTMDGWSMYGPDSISGTYPGRTLYTDSASQTFNTSTGVVSGTCIHDGVAGQLPGCDLTKLNIGIDATMKAWAYSR